YHSLLKNGHSNRITCIASRWNRQKKQDQDQDQEKQEKQEQKQHIQQISIATEPPSPSPSPSFSDSPANPVANLEWNVQNHDLETLATDHTVETKRELIASGGEDCRVVCWDLISGEPFATQQDRHR
ncbi:hypothetical protein BGZ94_006486, partial [Podila epigama]